MTLRDLFEVLPPTLEVTVVGFSSTSQRLFSRTLCVREWYSCSFSYLLDVPVQLFYPISFCHVRVRLADVFYVIEPVSS